MTGAKRDGAGMGGNDVNGNDVDGPEKAGAGQSGADVRTGDDAADCLIVGGGPAGLTAAIYLGRFHRSAIVVDADEGRLSLIPTSHNLAGFPEGIHGTTLLERMGAQARRYGAPIVPGTATSLTQG